MNHGFGVHFKYQYYSDIHFFLEESGVKKCYCFSKIIPGSPAYEANKTKANFWKQQ